MQSIQRIAAASLAALPIAALSLGVHSLAAHSPSGGAANSGGAPAGELVEAGAIAGPAEPGANSGVAAAQDAGMAQLVEALAAGGVDFDPVGGHASIEARVATRDDLLEFFLTGPSGSGYESLFSTEADATILNAAFLALGMEPGQNARWVLREDAPAPASAEQEAGPGELGARPEGYDVLPPEGPGLLIYVGWRVGDETYFFRAEDLIADLERQQPLQRHRWVFLGSRMVDSNDGEVFVAAMEQNYVNIAWFSEGNTLLTSARPECERQDIWVGNPWLVPEPDTQVRIFFSRDPLTSVPAELEARLPITAR
ncbi:YdjY domain-containing protein [Engelhardtia mirabilis]|uniref:Uncharacterized protein n=1 Tax=Engelhardtia mirabilis TaxID=2528011 RepID=A0A518BQL7_9BACT|nr:hypothetical protein Pla133_43570 [Planctomycetes bacterium Pla133]QDV03567.1 hypothetical protein Pla86_43560 [Planctomycetes bacterium Pla86]